MAKLSRGMVWVSFIALVFIIVLVVTNFNNFEDDINTVLEKVHSRFDPSQEGIPVLMYHHIVEDLTGFEGNEAVVSVDQFRKQMEFLAQEGYMTLNAQQLLDFLNGEPFPENTVVITFDDGYESNYIYAFPILKELELTAIIHVIVAVTPGEIGGEREGIPKISWEQMKTMVRSGAIDIQAHTFDSHYYAQIDKDGKMHPKLAAPIWLKQENRVETEYEYIARITEDLQLSESMIEQNISNDVIALAYPFGVHNDIIRKIMSEKSGLKIGFTVRPGYVKPGDDPLLLNRINVSPKWTLDDFIDMVQQN